MQDTENISQNQQGLLIKQGKETSWVSRPKAIHWYQVFDGEQGLDMSSLDALKNLSAAKYST